MIACRNLRRLAALVLASAALAAHAGGPLNVCNSQALKYAGTGTVNLNYDGGGTLGTLSKAQADSLVGTAVALWTNVGTSTVVLGKGSDLPVDVTVANYATYFDNYSDGLNPVIYDTDGSIVDQLLGVGAKGSVLGFAGSAYFGAPTCQYAEGQAVISGYLLTTGSVTTGIMSNVITHEIGHLVGLDHTQLDSSQGLASSNYPMMYPVAYRSTQTLHEDDVAAISALYPDATLGTVYGQLSGSFTKADGVTAVLGANLWAQETTTGKVYSIVSDYLKQGTGFWKLLLPAGTYTLHAEAIDSTFNGGSSVGPYSESYPGTFPTDASFQAPLYSGGTPMAPVTLGGASPVQFVISAGCAATSTFRIDGSGAVTGNCSLKSTPTIALGSSVNPSAVGQAVTFTANLGGSSGAPTGTVAFLDGATTLCAAAALSGGTATCSTSALASGSHSITASYGGSASYNPVVSSAVSQVVNLSTPNVALVSSANPSVSGQ
ncbi:MAG TPA: Ig-like domain repeat protein, partial [Gemmatimonadales bacterium]|nr:Ig-like domain repeat protein [Gemmatimonadales bacterium]